VARHADVASESLFTCALAWSKSMRGQFLQKEIKLEVKSVIMKVIGHIYKVMGFPLKCNYPIYIKKNINLKK
jgi:hypothetical protein